MLRALPFPPKRLFGGDSEQAVQERLLELQNWLRGLMVACPHEPRLLRFLAPDHSLDVLVDSL